MMVDDGLIFSIQVCKTAFIYQPLWFITRNGHSDKSIPEANTFYNLAKHFSFSVWLDVIVGLNSAFGVVCPLVFMMVLKRQQLQLGKHHIGKQTNIAPYQICNK